MREAKGYSQTQLSACLGGDHYTFISQVERGRARIPPDRYRDWAEALSVSPGEFARQMLRYYDPTAYDLLFPEPPAENSVGC